MKIDSLIFDLDGTLWDSRSGVLKAWNEVLAEHPETGRGTLSAQEILPMFGLPMDQIRDTLLASADKSVRDRIMEEMCRHENEYLAVHGGKLFPGLRETLEKLREDWPLFIVSNCQDGYIEAFLAAHDLDSFFTDTECWGRTHVSKDKSIEILMKRNGLKSPVYIGDTAGDEKAAGLAGIPFFYAAYGFGTAERPVAVVPSFADLPKILKEGTAR